MPLIVLSDYFKKQANPTSAHWQHDTHFSRVGHRWCAEAVADFLIDRGWVPGLRHTGTAASRRCPAAGCLAAKSRKSTNRCTSIKRVFRCHGQTR